MLMGDEKETWKVKTLDEILLEKKRRRELEERTDPKRQKNFTQGLVPQADDREAKRDTPEEGELRDQKMEITIRNSPYTREDSTEDRGEEDESLAIKPPQQIARKDKSHHRKEEKRKIKDVIAATLLKEQGNMYGPKTKKKSERAIAGSVNGKKTKPGETGSGRNEGNRPGPIHAERDLDWILLGFFWTTGTGWSSWNASANGTESFVNSKKSNGS